MNCEKCTNIEESNICNCMPPEDQKKKDKNNKDSLALYSRRHNPVDPLGNPVFFLRRHQSEAKKEQQPLEKLA